MQLLDLFALYGRCQKDLISCSLFPSPSYVKKRLTFLKPVLFVNLNHVSSYYGTVRIQHAFPSNEKKSPQDIGRKRKQRLELKYMLHGFTLFCACVCLGGGGGGILCMLHCVIEFFY